MLHPSFPLHPFVIAASDAHGAAANFTTDLALVLVFAAVAAALFRPLRLPALVGYLLAGVVIGPYTPIPVFADPARVHAVSEFGVILVMFCVGLEFTIAKFVAGLPRAGGVALLEMTTMAALGYALAGAFGLDTVASLFVAGCLAISSTMVVAKIFERTPPDTDVRELVFSALVLQDMAAIVVLAVLTAVAAGVGLAPEELFETMTRLGVFLVALVLGGLLLVPRLVRWVDRIGTPETRVVFAVALCFGLGYLAHAFGYSGALGAFVAGVLVAESGRGHSYERLVRPVQDVFVAVFFVSVGMSFDPVAVWNHIGFTLAMCATIIVGQFASVSLGGVLTGVGVRRSVVSGLALGQIGEFAFIIAGVGAAAGVVPEYLLPCLVAAAVVTSLTSPLAFGSGASVAGVALRWIPERIRSVLSLYEAWFDQLRETGVTDRRSMRRFIAVLTADIVALIALAAADQVFKSRVLEFTHESLGLSHAVSRLLHQVVVIVVALPFVLGMARTSARLARSIGDQLLPTIVSTADEPGLDLARAPRRALVVSLQLAVVTVAGFLVLAFTQPFTGGLWNILLVAAVVASLLPVLWRDSGNLDGHMRAGAHAVVSAVRVRTPTAKPLGPESRHEDSAPTQDTVRTLLPGIGHIDVAHIDAASPLVGRRLGEIALQRQSGAIVLAVARNDGSEFLHPNEALVLQAGDTLALTGSKTAVRRALTHLTRTEAPDH